VQPERPVSEKGFVHSPFDPVVTSCSDPGLFTSFSYSVLAGYSTLLAPPASAKVEAISGEETLVPPIVHQ
jgi:hypothetical protein